MEIIKTILCILTIIFVPVTVIFICDYFCNPFVYPYRVISLDISGKRNPDYKKEIEKFINSLGIGSYKWIDDQKGVIEKWKNDCKNNIQKTKTFREHRMEQFESVIDDQRMFTFMFTKSLTKYRQQNYVRESYKDDVCVGKMEYSYEELKKLINQLEEIDFCMPLDDYYAKNQRSLMTKELKQQIKIRDRYTCQCCGKYMPDEVGLHIDHIVPVSKGGKSIPSNLQVLCDKCNLKKGARDKQYTK